jgi:dTDP-4-dehydrorhamnose 3,5-epimerase
MKISETSLPGVIRIEPRAFGDERGLFMETFQHDRYRELGILGAGESFVQDNFSRSKKGTVRGLHFQEPQPQGKLVYVTRGAVFDVAVDVRRSSPTFARWVGATLSEDNHHQLWIPPGFAHGFCVLSDQADFVYKCTTRFAPDYDRTLAWNDPEIAIAWPLATHELTLSPKDRAAPTLASSPVLPA